MEPPLKFNCDYMCNCSFGPLESCRHAGLCFIEMITQKQIHPPPSSSGLISSDGSLESNAITQTSERDGRGPLSVIDGGVVCCTNTGAQRGPLFRLNKALRFIRFIHYSRATRRTYSTSPTFCPSLRSSNSLI